MKKVHTFNHRLPHTTFFKLLTAIIVIFLNTPNDSFAVNKFWVGGTGNWSDNANHWRTTSGGTTVAAVPTASDNVYFDAYSFSASGQTVTINVAAACNDMNWTGALNSPRLAGTSTLSIAGSLTFISAMNLTYTGELTFSATTTGKTVSTGGIVLKGRVYFGNAAGGGWNLQDSLTSTARIDLRGTLNTNNNKVTCSMFVSNAAPSRVLNPGNSIFVITGSGAVFNIVNYAGSSFTLGANTSTIRFTASDSARLFYSHAANCPNFNNIEWTKPSCKGTIDNQSSYQLTAKNVNFAGDGIINGNNTINGTLSLAAGKTYTFPSAKTQTFGTGGDIIANGSYASPITIKSSTAGSAAIFSKSSGSNIAVDYVNIKDNKASGGTTFTATNSINNGNVTGWSFIAPITSLFWINGSGIWNDPAHWSISSGGTPGGFSPDVGTNVIFDANSFSVSGQTVTINVAAACNDMNWTGALNSPTLAGTLALNIAGSLTLINAMNLTYSGTLTLSATATGKTVTTNGTIIKGRLNFGNANSGGWTLQDSLKSNARIDHNGGTLNTNDKNISCTQFGENGAFTRILNLGSSVLTMSYNGLAFFTNYAGLTINPGTSTLRFTAADSARIQISSNITSAVQLNNIEWINATCLGNIDNRSIYQLTLNNVDFVGSGKIFGANTFNGTLSMAAGKTYTFASGKTQTFGTNGNIISNGTCANLVNIMSSIPGSAATLSKSASPLVVWWADIRDIVAGGSLPFTANSSVISGVSSGWTTPMNSTVSITAWPSNIICLGDTVTYSAIPTNGGTNPTYSWFINGIDQNVDSTAFTPANIANNDIVQCRMASNLSCGVPVTAASNNITMNVVQTTITPAVTITASPTGNICYSTPVTFTATNTTGGSSPVFKWMVGIDTVGTGSTYSSNTLTNGTVVKCIMTSSLTCTSPPIAVSNAVTMSVTTSVAPILRVYTYPECLKDTIKICPNTSVQFWANTQFPGTSPSFIWKKNGIVVGNSTGTYTTTALADNDVVNCIMISNAACAIPATVPSVYNLNVQVDNKPPAIFIYDRPMGTHVCGVETKEYYATYDYAGNSLPTFAWKQNTTYVSGFPYPPVWTVISSFANNDQISCIMTTNTGCAGVSTATSNIITMQVAPPYTQPTLSIVQEFPEPGPICADQVFFRAHWDYSGYTPTYQWYNKGVPITNATSHVYYRYFPQDGDSISCRMVSNSTCINAVTATSNGIRLTVLARPMVTNGPSNKTICVGSNAAFAITALGGPPLIYQWQVSTNSVDWADQSDAGVYSGMNTATMQVTGATAGMHDLRYRCSVSNGLCSVNSPIAKLSLAQPAIINDPVAATVCEGSPASFSVSQISGETISSFSWQLSTDGGSTWNNQENSTVYSGMHSTEMNINTVTTAMDGNQYRCIPSGGYCTTTSNAAALTVTIPAPAGITITAFPGSVICPGANLTFTATPINGGIPVYQWYLNNAEVGTNSSTFSSGSLVTGDQIKCTILSNASCISTATATSNTITITVKNTLFWIGGSGNWSDPGHWSLDSLPPRNPNLAGCIPNPTTDVYFDQYSGFTAANTVSIDIGANCKSMDWSGSLNHPTLDFDNNFLNIYGSLRFISDMDVDTMAAISFSSDDAGKTIRFDGARVNFIGFMGNGAWTLLDSISAQTLKLTHGNLNTNDQTITVDTMALWPKNALSTVDFGTSNLKIGTNFNFWSDFLDLDADSSYINFTKPDNVFAGWSDSGFIKNIRFNEVIFQNASLSYPKQFGSLSFDTVIFRSDGYLDGNSSFNNLLLSGGSTYTFESGCTDTIWHTWSLPSSSGNQIILQSSDSGNIAGIYKPHHCVEADWLQVYDIEVMGGATFYAGPPAHSYLRNSPGWVLDTLDSPWIGNSSDWNTGDNWDLSGAIPNINTNVRLTTCGLHDAVISSAGAYCDTLILDPGTSLTILGSNTLDVYGDWVANGSFTCNTSTVNFKGNSTLYGSYPLQFYNVGIDAGNSLDLNTGYGIKIGGDFLNDGKFSPNEGKITFNGDGQQQIRMNGDSLYDVEFSNTWQGAGFDDFILEDSLTVTHEAMLNTGVLKCLTGADVIITDGAWCNEGSDLSYVDGRVVKRGNSSFTFPTGDSAIWAPVGIDAPSANSNISAQYYFSTPPDTGAAHMNTGMESVSEIEYWDLTSNNAYPQVTLFWKDGKRSNLSDPDAVEFAHRELDNGINKWTSRTGLVFGDEHSGSVTSDSMTSYSPMTFGKRLSNPLPVTLRTFEANCSNGMVWIKWSTATETNSDHYFLERSADLRQWNEIANITAAGNSNELKTYEYTDDEPLDGISYYQLKQFDHDGAATIYGPISTHCSSEGTFVHVYPNPFSGIINIEYFSDTPEDFTVLVLDVTGREVYRADMLSGQQNSTMDLSSLTPGIYYLGLKTESESRYFKIVKE